MKTKYLLIVIAILGSQYINAQVGMTGNSPDKSAALDLNATNKGLLMPRVNLTSISDVTTIPSPATGLQVFNIASAGTAPNNVTPGNYYWNGTKWVKFTYTGEDWSINGNAGTSPGTNFIGTTDNQPLQFKINNTNAGKLVTNNTAFGYNSGATNTAGTGNTFIGNGADATVNNLTNATAIGQNAVVGSSNNMVLGSPGTRVAIGTDKAYAALYVLNDNVSDTHDDVAIETFSNTYDPSISFMKHRGTKAAPANVAIGDWLGGFNWYSQINGTTQTTAAIRARYRGNGLTNLAQLIFITGNDVERMRIDEFGNVGIGTLAPSEKLEVNGLIRSTGALVVSDARYKTNIQTIPNALKIVNNLRGTTYEFDKAKFPDRQFADGKQYGVIAQEVEKVLPELVSTASDGYKAVNYQALTPVLIEAVKALQAENNDLNARLQKLEVAVNGLLKK
jgi:hypothetical protein